MSSKRALNQPLILQDPLEGEAVLLDAMFGEKTEQRRSKPAQPKPEHYKVVSISLYREDIQRLDGMVLELKKRGHYKANKSQLIRSALTLLNLDHVSKEH